MPHPLPLRNNQSRKGIEEASSGAALEMLTDACAMQGFSRTGGIAACTAIRGYFPG